MCKCKYGLGLDYSIIKMWWILAGLGLNITLFEIDLGSGLGLDLSILGYGGLGFYLTWILFEMDLDLTLN